MKKFLRNDIVQRVCRTFIQGFCASLIVSLKTATNVDKTLIEGALTGAIAGGICAVMNLIVQYLDKKGDVE